MIANLIKRYKNGEKLKFILFWSHKQKGKDIDKSCLSQWFEAGFNYEGIYYKSAEHFMMAQKAKLFKNEDLFLKIIEAKEPGYAKQLGREVVGFREDIWIAHRYNIVKLGNYLKFSQNLELKEFLLNTKNRILAEASPVDKIWGIGLIQDDKDAQNPIKWRGLNLLGFALMDVREELKSFLEFVIRNRYRNYCKLKREECYIN